MFEETYVDLMKSRKRHKFLFFNAERNNTYGIFWKAQIAGYVYILTDFGNRFVFWVAEWVCIEEAYQVLKSVVH